MASDRLGQNGDYFDNTHVQKLVPPTSHDFGEAEASPRLPSNSYDAVDTFGEPEILPRIGDEYQAEVPQLIGDSISISHRRKSTYAETRADADQKFLVGLPIALRWISSVELVIPGSCSSSRTCPGLTHSDSKNINKTEISIGEMEPSHDPRKSMEESQNLLTSKKICKCSDPGCCLVPGLHDEDWSAAEKDCFLLGLYIFEKNLVEVRRFVGTKMMGAVLSYYYGKFYSSPEYHRWSECRRMKNKKGIVGQRMFSGHRQQELLSRLLPRASEERRNALLEVSKTFGDGKMSLADYIFSLRAIVGTNVLVEAVGIGKGKQNLKGTALESTRSNRVIHLRPDIPTGKAWSSLTTAEIMKFLSGDYRLSKARSSDLFWEAVWPRLLARGWHSEQPKDQGSVSGSRHCLVFLMPGVKKFSRSKLVKGDQYFDSVTDVLSRVAREPGLIELNTEVDGSKRNEYECTNNRNSKQNDADLHASQRHFYLQPRTPNHSTVLMQFTVVDTSLSDGKVRELKTLPSETSNAGIAPDQTEDSDGGIHEEYNDNSRTTDIIMLDALAVSLSDEEVLLGKKDSKVSVIDEDARMVCPDISAASIPEDNKKDLQENIQSGKVSESLLSRTFDQENGGCTAPITKLSQILVGCSQEESQAGVLSSSVPPGIESGLSNRCSDTREVAEHLSQASQFLDKLPSTSSSRGSSRGSIKNPRAPSFDLNLPPAARELSDEQDITSDEPSYHHIPDSDIQASVEEQANSNPRRYSTRTRPPTTRVMEAVARGYLTINQRRKRKESTSDDGQSSRPSRRACGMADHNESTDRASASLSEAAPIGASTSDIYSNMSMNGRVPPEAKDEDSVSGQ